MGRPVPDVGRDRGQTAGGAPPPAESCSEGPRVHA